MNLLYIIQPSLRRLIGGRVESCRYPSSKYMTLTEGGEPKYYEKVVSGKHKEKQEETMKKEMKSLQETIFLNWYNFLKAKGHSRINGCLN